MLAYDASREALYHAEVRPTLFVAGHNLPLTQIAMEAARLAYVRAETAASEQARLDEALSRVGFGAATRFVHAAGSDYGFASLRLSDGTRLVAFRGTQPDDLNDLLTDLNFPPVDWPESGGHAHQGFARAARGLLPQARAWLAGPGAGTGPVVLAGHSLGAAIATLAATVIKPTQLVTMGSPRVGDAGIVSALASMPVERFVDCTDIVATVPPPLLGYVHVRPPAYIDSSGRVQVDPSEASMASDGGLAKVTYTLRHAWMPGNVRLRSFADHAPINYLRVFF